METRDPFRRSFVSKTPVGGRLENSRTELLEVIAFVWLNWKLSCVIAFAETVGRKLCRMASRPSPLFFPFLFFFPLSSPLSIPCRGNIITRVKRKTCFVLRRKHDVRNSNGNKRNSLDPSNDPAGDSYSTLRNLRKAHGPWEKIYRPARVGEASSSSSSS